MNIKIYVEDRLFSRYIRTRDGWKCKACGKSFEVGDQGLQCSHYWSRGNWGTRFDPDNCDALCFSCHQRWGGDYRSAYERFKRSQLGEQRYNALMIRAHSYAKKDRKLALLFVRGLIKQAGYDIK